MLYFFFFSSRRRHTRSLRDWSSDVCSSDLAISLGEVQRTRDPRISEWGNPAGRKVGHPARKRGKRTRGTETSQYPEEEKATAIPKVAASEIGPAQTGGACTPGVVGPRHGSTTPR